MTGLLAVVLQFFSGSEPRPDPRQVPAPPPLVVPAPARPEVNGAGTSGGGSRATTQPTVATPDLRGSATPPLVLGERLYVADMFFVVRNVEASPPRDGKQEIRVTFQATAGDTMAWLWRDNVRILSRGQVLLPVEGFSGSQLQVGESRQFWVRFEVRAPLIDPLLSFTDNMSSPRGEARRALPLP